MKGKLDLSYIEPKEYIKYLTKIGRLNNVIVPKTIIFSFQNSLLEHIISTNTHAQKIPGVRGNFYNLGAYGVASGFGIGPSVAAMMMEELIALGAKKFISIGTAGVIQKEIAIGDILLINSAIREDGVSDHYLKKKSDVMITKTLMKDIEITLKKTDIPVHKGKSWTTAAPYRETIKKIRKYRKQGVLSVEMEIAPLASVAQFHNVSYSAVLVASDSLADLKWNPQQQSDTVRSRLNILFDCIIKDRIYQK